MALIITYTILGVPENNVSIIYTKTLFKNIKAPICTSSTPTSLRVLSEGIAYGPARRSHGVSSESLWEFPKIRGTLFWGPDNKDPTT